jgi:hypothetical protein
MGLSTIGLKTGPDQSLPGEERHEELKVRVSAIAAMDWSSSI